MGLHQAREVSRPSRDQQRGPRRIDREERHQETRQYELGNVFRPPANELSVVFCHPEVSAR